MFQPEEPSGLAVGPLNPNLVFNPKSSPPIPSIPAKSKAKDVARVGHIRRTVRVAEDFGTLFMRME